MHSNQNNPLGNHRSPHQLAAIQQAAALQKATAIQKAYKNVRHAERILLTPNLNLRYRTISYLRLCCSAIVHYRNQGIDLAPELDAGQPYLKLLKDFYQRDTFWAERCEVSDEGWLVSSDPKINRSLQLLQRCILQISLDHKALQARALTPQTLPVVL